MLPRNQLACRSRVASGLIGLPISCCPGIDRLADLVLPRNRLVRQSCVASELIRFADLFMLLRETIGLPIYLCYGMTIKERRSSQRRECRSVVCHPSIECRGQPSRAGPLCSLMHVKKKQGSSRCVGVASERSIFRRKICGRESAVVLVVGVQV